MIVIDFWMLANRALSRGKVFWKYQVRGCRRPFALPQTFHSFTALQNPESRVLKHKSSLKIVTYSWGVSGPVETTVEEKDARRVGMEPEGF